MMDQMTMAMPVVKRKMKIREVEKAWEETLNPKPLNPKPETLNPKPLSPWPLNPKP